MTSARSRFQLKWVLSWAKHQGIILHILATWSTWSPSHSAHISTRRISNRSKYVIKSDARLSTVVAQLIHVHGKKIPNSLACFIIQKGSRGSFTWLIIDVFWQSQGFIMVLAMTSGCSPDILRTLSMQVSIELHTQEYKVSRFCCSAKPSNTIWTNSSTSSDWSHNPASWNI